MRLLNFQRLLFVELYSVQYRVKILNFADLTVYRQCGHCNGIELVGTQRS
jgi:hypothetical protein